MLAGASPSFFFPTNMLAESNLSPICSDLVSALCASRLELLAFNINLNEALLAYVKMLLHYFLREEL